MNTLEMKGDWNIARGRLKQQWARLVDDELQFIRGKENELIGRIQKSLGKTRKAVKRALRENCIACD
jgi:uncharacterized protein YjbJ (UPF0337 family)